MKCPNCQESWPDSASYCGACASPLKAEAQAADKAVGAKECPQCHAGAGSIDANGYCTSCGTMCKNPRDHFIEVVSAKIAGVCDIGMKYHENQDCMALGQGTGNGVTALVVCDGVSRSQNSSAGSKAAVQAACAVLREAGDEEQASAVIAKAIEAAQTAICTVPAQLPAPEDDPPAQATIVAALVKGKKVSFGWLGDSRAYWTNRKTAHQLTRDHSWYNWAVNEGGMSAEEAAADKRSHAILRSLGAALDGSRPPVEPEVRALNISEPGMLLVVSDGFWNYVKDEAHLVELVRQKPARTDALTMARHLVEFARQAGGHDNITVVVAMLS